MNYLLHLLIEASKNGCPDLETGIAGNIIRKEDDRHRLPPRVSFIDNVLRDPVEPEPGSVVMCDLTPVPLSSALGLNVEHSGIYAGNGEIIHRSGEGYLERASPEKFLDRLEGLNSAISIYVACKGKKALAARETYERAVTALSDPDQSGYDILNKNCHHFTRYCLTGETDQWGLDFTFFSLESLLQYQFGLDNWRVWIYY